MTEREREREREKWRESERQMLTWYEVQSIWEGPLIMTKLFSIKEIEIANDL